MAVRCPEQWRQRYVLGRKLPPSLSMIGGRADHAAIATSMEQKIESHVDLPVSDVMDLFVQKVETEVDFAGGLSELEWREEDTRAARTRAFDDIRSSGRELVACYHRLVSPFLQPLSVEREFEVFVPGVPVKMIGYIDLEVQDAQRDLTSQVTENRRLVDRKRRNRSTAKIEPEWAIQAEVYQLVEPLPFEFHLSVATKNPQAVWGVPELTLPVPERERSERLIQQIVSSIGFFYMRYGPDEPWPAQGRLHPWACGYCGYRAGCWAWK